MPLFHSRSRRPPGERHGAEAHRSAGARLSERRQLDPDGRAGLHVAGNRKCQRRTAPLNDAITALGRVLRQEPGRLDINMNSAARDMNVRQVIRALRAVQGAMQRTDSNIRLMDDFLTGVDQLEGLEREWSQLVDQHRRWEEVESTLRLIDESIRALEGDLIGDPLAELRTQFSFLTGAVSKLIASDGGDWLDALRAVHEKLDAALAHGDEGGSRNHYVSFRSLLGRRFENLDTELKNLCRDLSSLGRRFDRLGA